MKPIIASYKNLKVNNTIPLYGAKKLKLLVLMVLYCLMVQYTFVPQPLILLKA